MSQLGYAYKSYVWNISKHTFTQGISRSTRDDSGLRQFKPIFLQGDAYVLYADHVRGEIVLWDVDRDDYRYLLCRRWGPQMDSPAKHDVIGPWTCLTTSYSHGRLGFISTSGFNDRTDIECWDLNVASNPSSTSKTTMSLVAHGTIPRDPQYIVRVTQGRCTVGSLSYITLLVHYIGRKLYTALWKNCLETDAGNSTEPEDLQFFESTSPFDDDAPDDYEISNMQSLFTYSETSALLSQDKHWILDRQGRRLLWVPPEHRSRKGIWHWQSRKLFLDGKDGYSGFVVVDYSKVDWGVDKWEDVIASPPGITVSSSP